MSRQPGTLIMAANSLGCVEDIPQRSLTALQTSDLVIFEEDRQARRCLKAAGVTRSYLKLNEHGKDEALEAARKCFAKGQRVCYMSDQGQGNLADPGQPLIQCAYTAKARVVVIPGPCSVTAALAACPFFYDQYRYVGFLPREKSARLKALQVMAASAYPSVILETPYRRAALLAACLDVFGSKKPVSLSLDISGPEEDHLSGSVADVIAKSALLSKKLNFVLVVSGQKQQRPARGHRG